MYRFFLICTTILLLSACNQSDKNTVHRNKVGFSDTLIGRDHKIPVDMLMPTRMSIVGDYLVVFDQGGPDLFKVFELPELEYRYAFGRIGQGPDEFANIDPNTVRAFGSELVFLDNTKLVKMRIGKNSAMVLATHILPTGRNPLNRLQLVNDSAYVVDMMEGEYEYVLVDVNTGSELKKFGSYPSEGKPVSDRSDRYQKFLKSSVLSPVDGRFAVFYLYHNKIRFYEYGRFLLEVNINGEGDDYDADTGNPVVFRAEPYATGTNIYTLNIEKRKREIDFSRFRPGMERWTWDGDLIGKYMLDKPVISFCVSEKYGKMYGSGLESADKIYTFDLPVNVE